MFQESELVCLALAIPLTIPTVLLARAVGLPQLSLFVGAVVSALAAAIFTVVEDILWFDIFNALEHTCYALAGVLAASGCWRLARWSQQSEDEATSS